MSGTSTSATEWNGAARRAAHDLIKARARAYARRPQSLEALFPGLGCAAPGTLVAVAAHLVEREERSPRRWFGFGGEVGLVNARAALLLGRALRRAASRPRATTSAARPPRPATTAPEPTSAGPVSPPPRGTRRSP